jgi:hypothetical protein
MWDLLISVPISDAYNFILYRFTNLDFPKQWAVPSRNLSKLPFGIAMGQLDYGSAHIADLVKQPKMMMVGNFHKNLAAVESGRIEYMSKTLSSKIGYVSRIRLWI